MPVLDSILDRQLAIKLDTLSRRQIARIFLIWIIIYLTILLLGGLLGPKSLTEVHTPSYKCPRIGQLYDPSQCTGVDLSKNNSIFTLDMSDFNRRYEFFYLYMRIENIREYGIEMEMVVNASLEFDPIDLPNQDNANRKWRTLFPPTQFQRTVHCDLTSDYCDSILLFKEKSLQYKVYRSHIQLLSNSSDLDWIGNVDFVLQRKNPAFSSFEIGFKYALCAAALAFLVGFLKRMNPLRLKDWNFEQKWLVSLLTSLIGFNDPLCGFVVYSPSPLWASASVMLQVSFFAALMMFWLIAIDAMNRDLSTLPFFSFYFPKILLIGSFWILTAGSFTYFAYWENVDPLYDWQSEVQSYGILKGFGIAVVSIYLVWFLVLVYRAFKELRTLEYRFKLFYTFTLVVVLTMLGGILAGTLAPVDVSTFQFLGYHLLFNFYLFILTIFYLPAVEDLRYTYERDLEEETEDIIKDLYGDAEELQTFNHEDREDASELEAAWHAIASADVNPHSSDDESDEDEIQLSAERNSRHQSSSLQKI